MTVTEPRLGVDIGRVIIDGSAHPEGGDTAFFSGDEARMLRTPQVPRAFETLRRLVERFDGRVWLVSKCGPATQARTMRWLAHHDLPGRTGIPLENVRFCLQRPEKAIHCAELALTHFVDDKTDVHAAIRSLVPHRYLFGPANHVPAGLVHTPTWPEAEAAITATLR